MPAAFGIAPRPSGASGGCGPLLPVGDAGRGSASARRGSSPRAPETAGRPPRRARWKSPLRYRSCRSGSTTLRGHDSGRLARTTAWVPLTKVQSLRRVEGPAQRRLRLATVYLDTAGKNFGAAFRDLDERDSQTTLASLTELARAARRA